MKIWTLFIVLIIPSVIGSPLLNDFFRKKFQRMKSLWPWGPKPRPGYTTKRPNKVQPCSCGSGWNIVSYPTQVSNPVNYPIQVSTDPVKPIQNPGQFGQPIQPIQTPKPIIVPDTQ